ncbi:MAG TPA: DUF6288 domain-containing protein [Luteolibacter sp.]|nr:DUF6288 domain-containing protein [Luteolibacter sp.]
MKPAPTLLPALLATLLVGWSSDHAQAARAGKEATGTPYYTGEQVYSLQPKPEDHKEMGHVGPTGILAFVEVGVKVIIEGARPGSPAEGKVEKGEVILGVNGQALKGHNPYEVLGKAITKAEASDGKLVFDLESKSGTRQAAIQIPVLGAWGANWPVDCPKSAKIVERASAFYSKHVAASEDMAIPTALPCLFLLSTGDDAHLPVVRKHIQKFLDAPGSIGDNTWNNGYNGILFGEYYLRTGDKSVLPLLQAICDDAKQRQNYESAWKHWGADINPSYVGGGLMNPASTQVLTSLLLFKECGVNVDEKTLTNALRYFWRFVGHGGIPYGDHRAEGGAGSNGKDGMIAAAMRIAMDASGDTSIYQSAHDYQCMATLDSYPDMIMGHADNGRGDGIWRGAASFGLFDKKHDKFREVMDRITWWYDLSRYDDGAMGLASCEKFNDPGSGAAAAMIFTAPRKALRILGAPRSKHATPFQLPERIWGNDTDLVFHKIEPAADYAKHGEELPMHRIFNLIGTAYQGGAVAEKPDSISLDQLQRLVRHANYKVRAQAAKALRIKGELSTLEALLQDPDPRLRRAALDGINDWRYFFGQGKESLATEKFTPGMIKAITAMLSNPKESTYVVEGALFATALMPDEVIAQQIDAIMPWTKHQDWWLREASFTALHGLQSDAAGYAKVLPTLSALMVAEGHTMPRQRMNESLADSLKKYGSKSELGQQLAKAFDTAVAKTELIEGPRSREGKYNITHAIAMASRVAPETTPQLMELLAQRGLQQLDDKELMELMNGARALDGILAVHEKLKGDARQRLETVLYEQYRPEIAKRLKADKNADTRMIDALLGIVQYRDSDAGWKILGTPSQQERAWHYLSFEPTAEKDILAKREGKRFREVTLPAGTEGWFKPEFDASSWKSGPAPIGKGGHPRAPKHLEHRSPWGDGEFLLARTTFELDDTRYDLYRLRTICTQGFDIYLNGKKIQSFSWWADPGENRKWPMSDKNAVLLKKGTNTLAITTTLVYPSSQKPHWKDEVFGHVNCYIEGLKKEDLY